MPYKLYRGACEQGSRPRPAGGGIGLSGGEQGGPTLWPYDCRIDKLWNSLYIAGDSAEGKMSESQGKPEHNYRKPLEHTRFKKCHSGNPRGRRVKNFPALLAA